jgi:signal transduction histidine kinase
MRPPAALAHNALWLAGGVVLSVAGALLLTRLELTARRDAFETDARIVHRLLSQRAVQHEAILDTLALLQPAPLDGPAHRPEQRLPALYPQIVTVTQRASGISWPEPALAAAEATSRQLRHPVLADADLPAGRYRLVLAAGPVAWAMGFDLSAAVPWSEWPMAPDSSPVRVALVWRDQQRVIQAGSPDSATGTPGWDFRFRKTLAAASQPFDVVASQHVGWNALPWARIAAWTLVVAGLTGGWRHLLRQRAARRRAEELLRLGQVARLNTLGELAAGMAHEVNQPLTALLASTQAARRLLDEEPPDIDTARDAMAQAAAQARRAADVVGRLRRVVEHPEQAADTRTVSLHETARRALDLLEPECQRRGVRPLLRPGNDVAVLADPVALDQVVHNLLMNALQALEQVDTPLRQLVVTVGTVGPSGQLSIADTGPGMTPEVRARAFEPFFSTRSGGLGLGLSLCETLVGAMGGRLSAGDNPGGGTRMDLVLPRAPEARA